MLLFYLSEQAQSLFAMTPIKGLHHLFQRIRGLSHGGYDDQYLLSGIGPQDVGKALYPLYTIDTGSPEFENFVFHGANIGYRKTYSIKAKTWLKLAKPLHLSHEPGQHEYQSQN